MRYKYIMSTLLAAAPIAAVFRAIQLIKHTDHTTGFLTKDKTSMIATIAIIVVILVQAAISATVKRAPLKCPKVRKPLGICAVLMAFAIGLEMLGVYSMASLGGIHKLILLVIGSVTVLFFLAYAFKAVKRYRLEKLLYALPTLYYAVKLVFLFISISPLSLISENAYLILACASSALFFMEFAKIGNGYDKNKSYKKIMVSGCLAVCFNTVFALPQMFLLLTNIDALAHQSTLSYISSLITAVYILVYLCAHFSNKNLKDHHYRKNKDRDEKKFLQIDSPSQEFYCGD